jgi:uncharacterized oxidoreductase
VIILGQIRYLLDKSILYFSVSIPHKCAYIVFIIQANRKLFLMQMTGNTILITGGGSGIGRGLAEAFHAKGNSVIITGRRKAVLDEVVAANKGMKAIVFDINDTKSIQTLAEQLTRDYPALNIVIHNAGIMKAETLIDGQVEDAEAMITTNLLGPIRLTATLLPLLVKQASSTLITVSSGLALGLDKFRVDFF